MFLSFFRKLFKSPPVPNLTGQIGYVEIESTLYPFNYSTLKCEVVAQKGKYIVVALLEGTYGINKGKRLTLHHTDFYAAAENRTENHSNVPNLDKKPS